MEYPSVSGRESKANARARKCNPIESVPPGADWTAEITGVVRGLDRCIDVYQRLKLPRTAINEAFLGTLGVGDWGRVVIHVLDSVTYSYTAWVPMSLLPREGVEHGVTVSAKLVRQDVAGKAREWVCQHFVRE